MKVLIPADEIAQHLHLIRGHKASRCPFLSFDDFDTTRGVSISVKF